jgi:hypothetical protein
MNTALRSYSQCALDCADLSALLHGGTCPAGLVDESPNRKAVTSHRSPQLSRHATKLRDNTTKEHP